MGRKVGGLKKGVREGEKYNVPGVDDDRVGSRRRADDYIGHVHTAQVCVQIVLNAAHGDSVAILAGCCCVKVRCSCGVRGNRW